MSEETHDMTLGTDGMSFFVAGTAPHYKTDPECVKRDPECVRKDPSNVRRDP